MISIKNVSFKVGGKYLLNDINLDFEPGNLHLIIGPNGAGKSTLIKIISGQINPLNGKVCYGDKNLSNISHVDIAKVRAVLSQNIELAFPLTVTEVVMMGRYPHFNGKPQKEDWEACEAAMLYFDINQMSSRNYLTLSGGEMQRVQFARILAQIWYPEKGKSRYLILDEPLTFLDVYYQFQFMNKIKELVNQRDIIVIGVVHDLNLAAKFGDKITLLNNGGVLATGIPREVFTASNIVEAYRLTPVIQDEGKHLNVIFQ